MIICLRQNESSCLINKTPYHCNYAILYVNTRIVYKKRYLFYNEFYISLNFNEIICLLNILNIN